MAFLGKRLLRVRLAALGLAGAMAAGGCGGRRMTSPNATGTSAGSTAVVAIGGDTYAIVPNISGVAKVKLASGGSLTPSEPGTYIYTSPTVDVCAGDWNGDVVVCGSYASDVLQVIDPASLVTKTYPTGLTGGASVSAGTCIVCGLLYDPSDDEMIVAALSGYALFDHKGSHAIKKTIPALPSENFGYDPTKNQVFSPRYGNGSASSLDLLDIPKGKLYSLDAPPPLTEPDHGAIDITTDIAIAAEEAGALVYLIDLTTANLDAPAVGSFQAPKAAITLTSSTPGRLSGVAVDPATHLAFLAADVGTTMAVAQLPVARGDPLVVADWVVTTIPAAPGSPWYGAGDPHGIALFTLPGRKGPYGLLVNNTRRWLAVVDLQALLAAPRSATDAHGVASTYDLAANGAVTYYPIPP
jgi:hypothetical protein